MAPAPSAAETCETAKEDHDMNKRQTGIALLLLVALSFPSYWALASDEDKSKAPAGPDAKKPDPDKAPKQKDRPRPPKGTADAKPDRDKLPSENKPPVILGKTVKLEFKLMTSEAEPTFTILCATDEYEISRKVSDTNGEQGVEITGKLTKFDEQGRLLLCFKAELHHRDNKEGGEATFTSKGSALLDIGKAKTLTVLGDTPLKVTATLAD
jgi:hypothetical protein